MPSGELILCVLQVEKNEIYLESGPPYLIFLHPALGPLWEVSRQKVRLAFFFYIEKKNSLDQHNSSLQELY